MRKTRDKEFSFPREKERNHIFIDQHVPRPKCHVKPHDVKQSSLPSVISFPSILLLSCALLCDAKLYESLHYFSH